MLLLRSLGEVAASCRQSFSMGVQESMSRSASALVRPPFRRSPGTGILDSAGARGSGNADDPGRSESSGLVLRRRILRSDVFRRARQPVDALDVDETPSFWPKG